MRIMRSEDEKVIAAQANNSIFNESDTENKFDYDVDFSFSEIKFRNEIAKDRKYGTSNIKPINRNKGAIKERLYREAIEEASRIRTGGYYNQLVQEDNLYGFHENIPGRLKERVNDDKVSQVNDSFFQKDQQQFVQPQLINNTGYEQMSRPRNNMSEYQQPLMENRNNNPFNQTIMPSKESNMAFEQQFKNVNNVMFAPPQNINNVMSDSLQNINNNVLEMDKPKIEPNITPYGKNQGNNIYDDIMNKVNEDILKQNKNESSTKVLDEGRQLLRQVEDKKNNIPYKKTEIYDKEKNRNKKNNGLVVRDCKAERYKNNNSSSENLSPLSWLCSVIFMAVPVIGFIISGIVSLIVPKNDTLKQFARVCLTCHMVASLVATYLYLSGTISLEFIKIYLSRI